MAYNKNWVKWIHASVVNYIVTALAESGTVAYTGAVNNSAGYPAGTSTITIDGVAGVLTVGNWIKIAGNTNAQRITAVTGSPVTTGVTLSPALDTAVVNDAVVTVYEDSIPFHVEGTIRKTGLLDDFVEVRVDGPHFNQPSKGIYDNRIEVNLLVQTNIEESKNLYKHQTTLGVCTATLEATIPVYKYGNDAGDDGTFIGCLTIVDEKPRDYVKVNDFGQLETNVRLRMATVEAHYELELEG